MRSLGTPAVSAVMVLLVIFFGGCIAHVTGSVVVDDVPFVAADCRSAAAYGGWGVEVSDLEGRRLRMGANLDGSLGVALFQPGAAQGEYLSSCGAIEVQSQHSRVNGIVNLEGSATFSCDARGHRIFGRITFENCH